MKPLQIHGFAPSTYTRSARMAAIEKGAAHELVPLAYRQSEHFALHPFGKMPILTHGDVTVFETIAIIAYVDRTFAGPPLLPDDPAALARTMTAVSVAIDYAYRPIVHGEDDPDGTVARRVLDWLDQTLADHCHVGGDQFGSADLFFAPMIDFSLARTDAEAVFGPRRHLRLWHDRMRERKSFEATRVSST